VHRAPPGTAPSTLLRAGAALLAVVSAFATSLVVATAASGPPDDPSATGMAHRAEVAQPEHGPDQGQPGQGRRDADHGQGGLHRHLSSGGVLGGGGFAGNPGRALGRPSVAVPGGVVGFPAPSDEQQPPRPVENTAGGSATGLPSTGGTSLRTTVTPFGSGGGRTGRSAPAPGAATLPDIVLVPPPALPAPPTFKPISPSFAVAPLVVLALGVLLLGGLIGLRIARRSG